MAKHSTFELGYGVIYLCDIRLLVEMYNFVFNGEIRLINIGDNLRKIFGYVLFKSLDQIWVLIKACRICINFGLDWNYSGG